MWTDITTKALQGSLFYNMRARLMGIDENYHDDLDRANTHPTLLPQEAQECGTSDKTKEVLGKTGAVRTLLAATKTGLPDTQRTHAGCSIIPLQECVGRQGMRPAYSR